jgi:hypothetical protein
MPISETLRNIKIHSIYLFGNLIAKNKKFVNNIFNSGFILLWSCQIISYIILADADKIMKIFLKGLNKDPVVHLA